MSRATSSSSSAAARSSRIGAVLLAVALSGCGPAASRTPGIDRSGWPPVDSAGGAPAGATLTRNGASVIFMNGSASPVWVRPPQVVFWTGGSPWVADTGASSEPRLLNPGESIVTPVPSPSGPMRAGVTFYASSPVPATPAWFVWIDVSSG